MSTGLLPVTAGAIGSALGSLTGGTAAESTLAADNPKFAKAVLVAMLAASPFPINADPDPLKNGMKATIVTRWKSIRQWLDSDPDLDLGL